MIAAIHQPQYLPWLGYFDKMRIADIFVILDDAQYKKNDWQNRNRIRAGDEAQWLTVPVCHKHGEKIFEIQINNRDQWARKHLLTIEQNYHKTPFFTRYFPAIEEMLKKPWSHLKELNMAWIYFLAKELGIDTKIVYASEFDLKTLSTERLVDLCDAVGADQYLAGIDGKNYMDYDVFKERKIEVQTQEYKHPQYTQIQGKNNQEFISHLCALDLLLNCGPNSEEF